MKMINKIAACSVILCFLLDGTCYAAKSVPLFSSDGSSVNLFDMSKDKTEKKKSAVKPVKENDVLKMKGNTKEVDNLDFVGNHDLLLDNYNLMYCSDSYKNQIMLIDTDYLIRPSEVSASFIDRRLEGTPLAGLGEAFKDAENKYGVNALFLTALAVHESNYGRSRIAQDKNNIFGFMAYDRSPYSSAGAFATKADCIDYVASYISRNYLSNSGKYFRGYSIADVNTCYATDPNWNIGIQIRLNQLLSK